MVMDTPIYGKAVTLKTNSPWESYGDGYSYIWQGRNTEDKRPLGKQWEHPSKTVAPKTNTPGKAMGIPAYGKTVALKTKLPLGKQWGHYCPL